MVCRASQAAKAAMPKGSRCFKDKHLAERGRGGGAKETGSTSAFGSCLVGPEPSHILFSACPWGRHPTRPYPYGTVQPQVLACRIKVVEPQTSGGKDVGLTRSEMIFGLSPQIPKPPHSAKFSVTFFMAIHTARRRIISFGGCS